MLSNQILLFSFEPVATLWLQYVELILVWVLRLQIKQVVNNEYISILITSAKPLTFLELIDLTQTPPSSRLGLGMRLSTVMNSVKFHYKIC